MDNCKTFTEEQVNKSYSVFMWAMTQACIGVICNKFMKLDVGALEFNVRDFISLVSWELQYWNSPHPNTGSIALGISMNDSESNQRNETEIFFK